MENSKIASTYSDNGDATNAELAHPSSQDRKGFRIVAPFLGAVLMAAVAAGTIYSYIYIGCLLGFCLRGPDSAVIFTALGGLIGFVGVCLLDRR